MKNRKKIIEEIYTHYNKNHFKNIIIFTNGFKAKGELCFENPTQKLLSIKNASICFYSANNEHELNNQSKKIEWLNIFSKEIIAFSFVE